MLELLKFHRLSRQERLPDGKICVDGQCFPVVMDGHILRAMVKMVDQQLPLEPPSGELDYEVNSLRGSADQASEIKQPPVSGNLPQLIEQDLALMKFLVPDVAVEFINAAQHVQPLALKALAREYPQMAALFAREAFSRVPKLAPPYEHAPSFEQRAHQCRKFLSLLLHRQDD